MVLPASAVPANVGVLSLVLPPVATAPVTGSTSSTTLTMAGWAGATVSTVNAAAAGVLEVPLLSVWMAVIWWPPLDTVGSV